LGDYGTKPIYFFGKLAAMTLCASFVAVVVSVLQKFGWIWTENGQGISLNRNIFFLGALMLVVVGVIFLMMGVLSELMVRIYYESQSRRPYKVRAAYRGAGDGGGDSATTPEAA